MADASKDAAQRLAAALDRIAQASANAAAARARMATQVAASPAREESDEAVAGALHPVALEALRGRLDSLIERLREGLAELA